MFDTNSLPSGAPGDVVTLPAPVTIPVVTPTPTGTAGVDVLVDLAGDTDLYCGENQDFVLFQHGSGFDIVYGFDPSDTGDVIAIETNVNNSGLAAVDGIVISDTEHGAWVDLGGDNGFLLDGVSLAELDDTDFSIHPEITPAVEVPVTDVPNDIPPFCGTVPDPLVDPRDIGYDPGGGMSIAI